MAPGRQEEGTDDPAQEELLRAELLELNRQLANGTRDLQKANAELARLGRLKDQFMGMAAHDLRSPLAAILAFQESLAEDLKAVLGPAQRADLAAIREAATLMRAVVDGFLDVALIETGRFRLQHADASLADVAERALGLVRPLAARAGVVVRLERGDDPVVSVDAARIEQVIINLLNNALQHSPRGAEVVIEVASDGEGVRLVVRDQGAGIPPEIARNLFTPFVRGAGRVTEGERSVGLGLTIARYIVEAHRGSIATRGEPSQGATFEVRLPADRPSRG
jgi:signal transduction histidine kinase